MLVGENEWCPEERSDGNGTIYFRRFNEALVLTGVLLGPHCESSVCDVRMALKERGMFEGVDVMLLRSSFNSYAIEIAECCRYENGNWHAGAHPRPM